MKHTPPATVDGGSISARASTLQIPAIRLARVDCGQRTSRPLYDRVVKKRTEGHLSPVNKFLWNIGR